MEHELAAVLAYIDSDTKTIIATGVAVIVISCIIGFFA